VEVAQASPLRLLGVPVPAKGFPPGIVSYDTLVHAQVPPCIVRCLIMIHVGEQRVRYKESITATGQWSLKDLAGSSPLASLIMASLITHASCSLGPAVASSTMLLDVRK
jgi:hypothetical protein